MTDGVKLLREVLKHPEKYLDILTVDDFFSSIALPVEHRTDFAFACYLKQAMEENSMIESDGTSRPTHDSSLYLYKVTLMSRSEYTFLIKAPNLVVALDEFSNYMSLDGKDVTPVMESLTISKLEFLGSVMQI